LPPPPIKRSPVVQHFLGRLWMLRLTERECDEPIPRPAAQILDPRVDEPLRVRWSSANAYPGHEQSSHGSQTTTPRQSAQSHAPSATRSATSSVLTARIVTMGRHSSDNANAPGCARVGSPHITHGGCRRFHRRAKLTRNLSRSTRYAAIGRAVLGTPCIAACTGIDGFWRTTLDTRKAERASVMSLR